MARSPWIPIAQRRSQDPGAKRTRSLGIQLTEHLAMACLTWTSIRLRRERIVQRCRGHKFQEARRIKTYSTWKLSRTRRWTIAVQETSIQMTEKGSTRGPGKRRREAAKVWTTLRSCQRRETKTITCLIWARTPGKRRREAAKVWTTPRSCQRRETKTITCLIWARTP